MTIATAIYSASIYSGGSWVDVTSSILTISGSNEATVNQDNGLAFGDSSNTRLDVIGKLALQSYAWALTPFKATFSINGSAAQAFQGVITSRERTLDQLTFGCEGYAALIRDTKVYSPMFYLRPVATKTTAASVEDPSDPDYVAGPLNWLMWQAGGRPYEQDFSYPSAKFYYSFDQALFCPPFAWFAGENGWDEALKLVQAATGQLYQDPNGTIIYRQPYVIADTAASFAYTLANFKDLREQMTSRLTMTQATVQFIPRELRPLQDVAEDTTARLIPASSAVTFDIEPKWPLYSLEALTQDSFVICMLAGQKAILTTDFSVATTFAAQRITLTVTNLATQPMAIYKVTLRGMPILPLEAQSVTLGSGGNVKTVVDGNAYVQTREDALWLAHLYMDFYAASHPLRTISGCLYDPDLEIGDVGTLTAGPLSISVVAHVVVSKRHSQTGAEMELDLVEIANLPKASDFFIVGVDYSSSGNKLVGY